MGRVLAPHVRLQCHPGPFPGRLSGAFGVLSYRDPWVVTVGGLRLVQTSWWVPPLFGTAGVIMGVLYVLLDQRLASPPPTPQGSQGQLQPQPLPTNLNPSWPKVFMGISLQYYLSGLLSYDGWDVNPLTAFLLTTSLLNFLVFDRTKAGLVVSVLTAISGPVAELFLINALHLYQYNEADWHGICSWIPWVYFMGGPAVGNLARRTKADIKMVVTRPPPPPPL